MTGSWFPWIEANQGFFSLIALAVSVVALVASVLAALHEQKRANNMALVQHRKAIAFARSLIFGFLDKAAKVYSDELQLAPALRQLRDEADTRARAFHALATNNAPDGRYAILAIQAASAFELLADRLKHQAVDQPLMAEIENILGALQREFFGNDPEAPIPVVDPEEVFAKDNTRA